MNRHIRLGALLSIGIGMLAAAAATAAEDSARDYRANYDIHFESAGDRQVLRGTAALTAQTGHVLTSSDWRAELRVAPIDCDTYRLELVAVHGAVDSGQRDLQPRLAVAGVGRYGAPLTLSAERAGLSVDGAFAVRRPHRADDECQ